MKVYLSLCFILLLLAVSLSAIPARKDCCAAWDDYTDPAVAGYKLYYALATEPEPRSYTDARSVDVGLKSIEEIVIKEFITNIGGSVCFRLTAYDATGRESGFSNEACGWFGMGNPQNLITK